MKKRFFQTDPKSDKTVILNFLTDSNYYKQKNSSNCNKDNSIFVFYVRLAKSSVHGLVYIYGGMLSQVLKNIMQDVKDELFMAFLLICSKKYLDYPSPVLDTVS